MKPAPVLVVLEVPGLGKFRQLTEPPPGVQIARFRQVTRRISPNGYMVEVFPEEPLEGLYDLTAEFYLHYDNEAFRRCVQGRIVPVGYYGNSLYLHISPHRLRQWLWVKTFGLRVAARWVEWRLLYTLAIWELAEHAPGQRITWREVKSVKFVKRIKDWLQGLVGRP